MDTCSLGTQTHTPKRVYIIHHVEGNYNYVVFFKNCKRYLVMSPLRQINKQSYTKKRPTTGLGVLSGLEWATKRAKASSSPGRSTTWASYATMIDTSCIILTPACCQQQVRGEDKESWWMREGEDCSWQVLFRSESREGNWLLSRVPQELSPAHK